jgi:endonuclease YncB( thermonuclease family)
MRALCALLCCIAAGAQAETFTARVVAVLDGDTVLILRSGTAGRGKPAKLRLANIDAPEKSQAYGAQSRASLLEMAGKREAQVDTQAVDQYGRMVGVITVDGRNLNQEQVRRGMAWEYSYHHADKIYVALQSEAQQARRGLWAQPGPQAPWQWRKLHPLTSALVPNRSAAPVMLYDMACGKKRYCWQMASCDEAHFHLTRCGVKTLDGNEDGEPCEDLCGGR